MPTNIGSADRNVGGSRTSDQGDSSGGQPRPPSRMRYVKGGSTRDIPVPESVIAYLLTYTKEVLPSIAGKVTPETALFWSTWGRRVVGRTRQPMTGKNLWRLTKFYGRAIGVPELKPHDLRHVPQCRTERPQTWSVKHERNSLGRPNGIRALVDRLRFHIAGKAVRS